MSLVLLSSMFAGIYVESGMTEAVDLQSVLIVEGDEGNLQRLPKPQVPVRWTPEHHRVPVRDLGPFS